MINTCHYCERKTRAKERHVDTLMHHALVCGAWELIPETKKRAICRKCQLFFKDLKREVWECHVSIERRKKEQS
jgi:hypothetical protein